MTIHLVRGNDPILRREAVESLVGELLGNDDRMLALEDHTVPGRASSEGEGGGGTEARAAVVDAALNAARTPPFMTASRVVVVRDVGNLTKEEADPLVRSLEDLPDSTALVLVVGGGTIPKSLDDAVKKRGVVTGPDSEQPADVLEHELLAAGLTLRPDATKMLLAHVGGDAGLVPGVVGTFAAVFGEDQELGVDEIAPYLGDAGTVPMWELTNALEQGDVARSLAVLHRLLETTSATQPKAVHPLQILGMLHSHYRRLLRLDDPGITTNEAAAAAIGGRTSPNAARHRLRQARTLGTDGLRQAFDYLVRADLDLKGDRAIPADAVVELLVTRLATLTTRAARRRV